MSCVQDMNLDRFKKKKLPDTPGVYFFLGRNKEILYIGKATSLRGRVRSYFSKDLPETRSPLIEKMVAESRTLDFKATDSVLEALLLETDLIKKFQPRYNSKEKDDKSYNCVVITKEDFPRILLVRKYDLDRNFLPTRGSGRDSDHLRVGASFGPFPQGTSLKEVLKLVRRIFPYRDSKCEPLQGRPCFNRQIGLCPGVCTGEISKGDYGRTIRNIKFFFAGRKGTLMRILKREMKMYAKLQEFERADKAKRTIFALQHIQDVALLGRIPSPLLREGTKGSAFRIEAYDIAHISGSHTVGVMTVVESGVAKKGDYRKFRIRGAYGVNDSAGLSEVLRRRLAHHEWTLPDLIVVDGNIIQKNAAEAVLAGYKLTIPVSAVVKNERHRPKQILGDGNLGEIHKKDILLANNEAHRFAIAYHRTRRDRI